MLDKGEFFKKSWRIMPGANGSYVVREDRFDAQIITDIYGFTCLDDMLKFFLDEAAAMKLQGAQGPSP